MEAPPVPGGLGRAGPGAVRGLCLFLVPFGASPGSAGGGGCEPSSALKPPLTAPCAASCCEPARGARGGTGTGTGRGRGHAETTPTPR